MHTMYDTGSLVKAGMQVFLWRGGCAPSRPYESSGQLNITPHESSHLYYLFLDRSRMENLNDTSFFITRQIAAFSRQWFT
jgi:hypothetical protein